MIVKRFTNACSFVSLAYHKRAFRLLGNLLFYLHTESQVFNMSVLNSSYQVSNVQSSGVAGVIILERSTVENDVESGNKYGFVISKLS